MTNKFVIVTALTLLLGGCAAPKTFNIKNDYIASYSGRALSTYADYGSKVEYNSDEKLHQLSVYTGGGAGCDNGAISYAKSKYNSRR